ncbi:hydrolase, hydrolyzing O-glycosyl compounds, putative [Ricinus communis]|uniref:Hydrolase, hydrolyzing O-glycosyl compounds, putative n=1 Tax=Ricinus communis TaxID=3988 RepID=B9T2F3_RICCO|nr:hydrolase, hydrolyzing O-glycosyl compounds, putative [Ricinus communis]
MTPVPCLELSLSPRIILQQERKCLVKPRRPPYGGGIIVNPEFRNSIEGWKVFGKGEMKRGISEDGNNFAVAYNRSGPLDSISQKVQLEKGKLYSFSAWVQISEGSETVATVFRAVNSEWIHGGYIIAKHGCWSLLKGGMVANVSGLVEILFECKNTIVDIWIDNVSLQPFTMEEWRSHQDKIIEKVRKTKVKLQATYANQTVFEGAVVSIKQTRPHFPFGCGMNHYILTSEAYRKWFSSRFKFTTFTNEMKWYSIEAIKGLENYTVADAMLRFAKENGISVRGHNILWDNPEHQPRWVQKLPPKKLRRAAMKRVNSVARRYSGQLIAWDVMNENLHFRFYEQNLGENASAEFHARTYHFDPHTRMFMNEYNTIECSEDEAANPVQYIKKLEEILSYPSNKDMLVGIGLQGHFTSGQPNLVYMRSALDILGSTKLPIWLTEVDVDEGHNQANYFEQILREGYSHPAVKGIIIFGGPRIAGFNVTTLGDEDFKNTPAGDVVDKLIEEWKTGNLELVTDSKGFAEVSLFHGDYELTVKHPRSNFSTTLSYKVEEEKFQETINLNIID